MNSIAPSAAGIATKAYELHRYILRELGYAESDINEVLPPNKGLDSMAEGLASAWKIYGNPKAVVLIVVEDRNVNIFDQRLVEYTMKSKAGN